MASFQAKIGWKWPRKRQKYKLSFRLVPTQYVIENKQQKNSKNYKILLWPHFKPKLGGKR